jgi:hypothetical protein
MKWGEEGFKGRRGRGTEKLHVTEKSGNDRQTGRARERIETGSLNKKWMGGHAKALCDERSGRERESSSEESHLVHSRGPSA